MLDGIAESIELVERDEAVEVDGTFVAVDEAAEVIVAVELEAAAVVDATVVTFCYNRCKQLVIWK